MVKNIRKNSKKGLTLPVAIVISIVLVILAAGLIFIALSSISTTTSTVNGRQAFMNVRSALEYVESYYNNKVDSYATIGVDAGGGKRVEYFSMREKEVSNAAQTYYKKGDSSVIDGSNTYVQAEYTPASGGDEASLKLTGFSHYADTFGNKGKWVTLSVTFSLGSAGSQNRVTIINYPTAGTLSASPDTIRLNLKLPIDLPWNVCYYIWTYKDTGNAYNGWNGASYVYNTDNTRQNPDLGKLNTSQKEGNSTPINGAWDSNNGPSSRMVSQSNGWFAGDYKINNKYVNFFNVIFSQEGATIDNNGHYDSQTQEIFHLWYLNPDDKNIYFEFLNKQKQEGTKKYYIKYIMHEEWDGVKGLDDTVLIYLRNQKITVHFRAQDENKNSVTNTLPAGEAPIITSLSNADGTAITGPTYLKSGGRNSNAGFGYKESTESKQTSNISMTYEGCGWWVANIESKKVFNLSINYKGKAYTISNIRANTDASSPDSTSESWIILKDKDPLTAKYSVAEAHQTENTALDALGVARTSYVTVHAKGYNPDEITYPKLKYAHNVLDSSVGRQKLYEKILEASSLPSSDYDNHSTLVDVLNKAINVYNNKNPDGSDSGSGGFIMNPVKYDGSAFSSPSLTDVEKADEAYQTYITALDDAIRGLVPAVIDMATLTQLKTKIDEAQLIHDNINDYDLDYHASFGAVYQSAKTLYESAKDIDNVTVKKQEAKEKFDNLKSAVDTINAHKLDRLTLQNLINEANNYKDNTAYVESFRDTLKTAITAANTAVNEPQQRQEILNNQKTALEAALQNVKNNPVPVPTLDTTQIDSFITQADSLLSNTENYTDTTKANLITAKDNAVSIKTTATAQSEIDSSANALQAAINRFTVKKPENTNADFAKINKIRVWFIKNNSLTLQINKISADGTEMPVTDAEIKSNSGNTNPYPNYYYFDIDKTIVSKLSVAVTEANAAGSAVTPTEIDIPSDNNLFIDIDSEHHITAKKLTTMYIPRTDADLTQYSVLDIKIGDVSYNYTTSSEGYFVVRYISDPNAWISIDTTISGNVHKKYIDFKIPTAGDYVLSLDGATAKTINTDDIYPKNITEPNPSNPVVQNTVVNAQNNYQIVPVATSGSIPDTFNISVPSGKKCLIFDTAGRSEFSGGKVPHIHIWKEGGNSLTKWNDGLPAMFQYESSNYYYYLFDIEYDHFIITNHNGGSSQNSKIIDSKELQEKDSSGRTILYYLVTGIDASGGVNIETYSDDTPGGTIPTLPVTLGTDEYLMAYVGGAKIRIKNKSYVETYPSGSPENDFGGNPKKVMSTSWKFGGDDHNGTENHYFNRVGDSKLLPYFDWYEYKIPVEQSNTYSLEISGLKYDPDTPADDYGRNIKTPVIDKVYGDVWVSLFNDTSYNDSGTKRFSNTEMLTFDPDKTQIGSETYLYFRLPQVSSETTTTENKDTDGNLISTTEVIKTTQWSSPKINEAHGTGATKVNISMSQLSRQSTIWRSEKISKNTPFITFSVQKTVTTTTKVTNAEGQVDTTVVDSFGNTVDPSHPASSETFTYKTKLMGGTYSIFNPLKNSGFGGWEKFQSDQDNLKDICDTLVNIYYGKYIVNQYDSSGEVVENGNSTKTLSNYINDTVIPAYSSYFKRSNNMSTGLWVADAETIENASETDAYTAYLEIKNIVESLEELYAQMSEAKAYIEIPIRNSDADVNNTYHPNMSDTSRYPEYINRGNTRSYSGISDLRKKLSQAEKAYVTGTNISKAKQDLDRALANISVETEGSIAVVLYDSQNKIGAGHKFEVRYNTKDASGNKVAHKLSIADNELNPEGYPLKFITENIIYDVQFYDKTDLALLGSSKDEMKKNEAWVFMDYADNPRWRENTATDYRQITTDSLIEGTDVDVLFKMNQDPVTHEYEPMTVYFAYDTKVKYKVGSNDITYTIKAGPYTFVDSGTYNTKNMPALINSESTGKFEMTKVTSSDGSYYKSELLYFASDTTVNFNGITYDISAGVYRFSNSDVGAANVPIEVEDTGGTQKAYINLLTDAAKNYFENNRSSLPVYNGQVSLFNNAAKNFFENGENYGKYTDSLLDATTAPLNWSYIPTGGTERVFATGNHITTNGNVNFDVSEGSFTQLPVTAFYSYSTNGGMNFRWSSPNPLYCKSGVKMYASEFRFASIGTIDATQYGNSMTHFYLYNYNNADSMEIEFFTDVNVAYLDSTGLIQKFVIREGKYRIEKDYIRDSKGNIKKDAGGNPIGKTEYIADIFNKQYWTSMEHVRPLSDNGLDDGNGGGGLSNPVYGD